MLAVNAGCEMWVCRGGRIGEVDCSGGVDWTIGRGVVVQGGYAEVAAKCSMTIDACQARAARKLDVTQRGGVCMRVIQSPALPQSVGR